MSNINLAGYKLESFNILNWGIFDKKVHEFITNEENALLTGDIGSGKSTLIDAMTTLLVPPRKVSYNLAAGAGKDERSVNSYFFGYYSSKDDDSGRSRSIGLRPKGDHISVILAIFKNEALNKYMTMATVFWFKSSEGKVNRFNVVAEKKLSIKDDFTDFGGKIADLKRRLRSQGAETFDSFNKYAQHFSKILGLGTDLKALELFNQTISMKSIGSVTKFTRESILERPNIEEEVEKLSENYHELNRLHETIKMAKSKIEHLEPIVKAGDKAKHERDTEKYSQGARDVIDAFVATEENKGERASLEHNEKSLNKRTNEQEKLLNEIDSLNDEISSLQQAIRDSGGSRIEELKVTIKNKEKARDNKRKLANIYGSLCREANIDADLSQEGFSAAIETAKQRLYEMESSTSELRDRDREISINLNKIETQKNEIDNEVDHLKNNASNIDSRLLSLRSMVAESVGADESRLPFVGELIRVKDEEKSWQGAIERVLRSFAMSMLVPEDIYEDVLSFVNNTHLRGKLIYFRVTKASGNNYKHGSELLCNKLEIKNTADFYNWLESELYRRFDHVCCEDHSKLRHYDKSVSITGQIKSGRSRHEKDDSFRITDQSRYVLGWNNEDKRKALHKLQDELKEKLNQLYSKRSKINAQLSATQSKISSYHTLSRFDFSFEDCDWEAVTMEIDALKIELKELSESSTTLKDLNAKVEEKKIRQREATTTKSEVDGEIGALKIKIQTAKDNIIKNERTIDKTAQELRDEYLPFLANEYEKIKVSTDSEIRANEKLQSKLSKWINNLVQRSASNAKNHEKNMQKAITEFFIEFHEESQELDHSIDSLDEFKARYNALVEEDLPRHEDAFKIKMQQETIQHMAMFQSRLNGWKSEMENVIKSLNNVLYDLTYNKNPETYIKISANKVHDEEIRLFQQDIQSAISYIGDDDLYSEQKFLKIQAIVEELQTNERWRLKVVDVRNWMRFSAIECYKETDEQKEAYSDSDGKSGGQKEKLAYLCLASAIILKYGLLNTEKTNSANRSRFNLVIIDEAFIRGSKESTKFGLELFKSLGLQLILVTPLMKLDIISQYISNVGYVDKQVNENSEDRSRVMNMSISQYLNLKREHDSKKQAENVPD